MWFGDLVTMKWWNDLWLNESFAEWASTIATAEATEWTEAWTTFNAMEKTWAYRQDQLPSTHPVVAEINDLEDVQVNFDGITYAKGGSVLKQLAAWVGIEAVLRRRRRSTSRSTSGRNTELVRPALGAREDQRPRARHVVEEVARDRGRQHALARDRDGRRRARSRASRSCRRPRPTTRRSARTASASASTTLTDDALVRVHHVELDVDGDLTEVPELKGHTRPDLVLLNDEDLAYAKIRLDDALAADRDRAPRRRSATRSRARSCGARPGIRRGMPRPRRRDYVDLVLRNIGSETESTTVRTTLAQLQLAANSYVAPEKRDATRAKVADALWELAAGRRGRQRQPAAVRDGVRHRGIDARAVGDRCAALRDGETTFDGLEIDTDLSWQLLVSLAAGGVAHAKPTSTRPSPPTTPRRAASSPRRRRRRFRTASAKQAAWSSLIDSDDLPNTIVRSTALGFAAPRQRRAARRVRAAVLRHAAADLGLAQLPDRAVPHRRASTRRRWRTSSCATPRAPGSRPTRMPPRRCAGSWTRTSPASSGRSRCRSATRLADHRRMPRPHSASAEASVVRIVTMITPWTSADPTHHRPGVLGSRSAASSPRRAGTRSASLGIVLGALIIGWILKLVIRRVVYADRQRRQVEGERRRHAGAGALAARRDQARPAHAHARVDPAEHRQRLDRHRRRCCSSSTCSRRTHWPRSPCSPPRSAPASASARRTSSRTCSTASSSSPRTRSGIGDVVDLGLATGIVEYVSVRVTHVRDVNGTLWYVRNGEITRIGNMSHGLVARDHRPRSCRSDADIGLVENTMLETDEGPREGPEVAHAHHRASPRSGASSRSRAMPSSSGSS